MNETNEVKLPEMGALSYQLWSILYNRNKENKGVLQTQEAYKLLESTFALTNEQKNVMNKSDDLSAWETKVRSAKNQLLDSGIIKVPNRGEYLITEKGIEKYEELYS